MKDKKAALFDFDGTLVDSMWVWDKLFEEYLNRHGYGNDSKLLEKISQMSLEESAAYAKEQLCLSETTEEIREEWRKIIYDRYVHQVSLKAGAKAYLERLKKDGIRLGLVTASDPVLCELCLKNNGIADMFDAITYVDEVGENKESPAVYLECLHRLACLPEESMLFEDILVGVQTGKRIGLYVTAVLSGHDTETEKALITVADRGIIDYRALLEEEGRYEE